MTSYELAELAGAVYVILVVTFLLALWAFDHYRHPDRDDGNSL